MAQTVRISRTHTNILEDWVQCGPEDRKLPDLLAHPYQQENQIFETFLVPPF